MKTPTAFSEAEREKRLVQWSAATGVKLASLDAGQRGVIFAALTFLAFTGKVISLRRMVAYLLSHCGMGLNSTVVGAVVGTTDRAVRKGRELAPREFWHRLQKARRGHAPPKLQREQVGLVAKYIAENKKCSVAELLGFIKSELGVEVDRLTLRRFLKRYGLGRLREDSVAGASPLFSAGRVMEEHSLS
jgi:transposase